MGRRSALTLGELLMVMAMLAVLAGVIIPPVLKARAEERVETCASHLSQLWKAEINYSIQFTHLTLYPGNGADFWVHLTKTNPPIIDTCDYHLLFCPVRAAPPRGNKTDYRGPNGNANAYLNREPVGADREENHGPGAGGNVLLKSGSIHRVDEQDFLWKLAARKTTR